MKSYVFKYTFLLLFGAALISILLIYNKSKEPESMVGMPYYQAREKILTDGWRITEKYRDELIAEDLKDFGYTHPLVKKGYNEIGVCTGIGDSYCDFYFTNTQGQDLRVIVKGENYEPSEFNQTIVTEAYVLP